VQAIKAIAVFHHTSTSTENLKAVSEEWLLSPGTCLMDGSIALTNLLQSQSQQKQHSARAPKKFSVLLPHVVSPAIARIGLK
jgi:hypothetical protein